MGEEDASIDDSGVAQLGQSAERTLGAHLLQEEAQKRAGFPLRGAAVGLHPSLLGEQAHTAGGLPLQVPPGVAAYPPGDRDLGRAVREQGENLPVAIEVKLQRRQVLSKAGAALPGQGENRQVRRPINVQLGGNGAVKRADGETRLLTEGAGQAVIAIRRLYAC